jgi:hypothetical protein
MNFAHLPICFIALTAPAASFGGDALTYDNEGELQGAAFAAVSTRGDLIDGTMSYCAESDKSFAARAADVEAGWKQRNAKYLALEPILRAEMHANALREGAQSKWREFDEKTLPAQKEYMRNVLAGEIKLLPASQQPQMCTIVATAMENGKMDFVNEAQLIGYLDRRVAEQKDKSK